MCYERAEKKQRKRETKLISQDFSSRVRERWRGWEGEREFA